MSFADLPDGFQEHPLTEPRLVADVLDLVVRDSDRREGAIFVLLCDEDDRLRVPCAIHEVDFTEPIEGRICLFDFYARAVAQQHPNGSLLVAVARDGALSLRSDDRQWRVAAEEACAQQAVRLLGVHVITPNGSRPVPLEHGTAA